MSRRPVGSQRDRALHRVWSAHSGDWPDGIEEIRGRGLATRGHSLWGIGTPDSQKQIRRSGTRAADTDSRRSAWRVRAAAIGPNLGGAVPVALHHRALGSSRGSVGMSVRAASIGQTIPRGCNTGNRWKPRVSIVRLPVFS